MWIINTRPKERANPLTKGLIQKGYQVFELPLLDLIPRPLDVSLSHQFLEFLDAEIVVVVSSIAATLGMQYYQSLKLPLDRLHKKRWIAVGQATQATLLMHGIVSECPDVETSEGMLQLPLLQKITSQKIAFWRGEGGRTLMIAHMQEHGIDALNMLLYSRAMPSYDHEIVKQLVQSLPAHILITSEASWKNWQTLCHQDKKLLETFKHNHYVVLGERVSNIVLEHFAHQHEKIVVKMINHVDVENIHQIIK